MQDVETTLADVVRGLYARGWAPAWSGNYSFRGDDGAIRISRTGVDKSRFAATDFLTVNLDGSSFDPNAPAPSAETPLHLAVYRLFDDARFVLHVHTTVNTVLSRLYTEKIVFSGFELQKSFAGQTTHEATLTLPVFVNSQDTSSLARQIEDYYRRRRCDLPGFLLSGHGLYVWGRTLEETLRHLEAFEFLLTCKWEMKKSGFE
ncbi:MAG: methylthioribulose 1-phosphate dehydratase [Bacteroidia bacterium]|nr:methylthioribulose 1-phosphate dehydratase [Bacteroidia bacterium]MDW8333978.1 methylthioribulose 1-phosphate dehydratase [Bacteroidia bacterium]